MEPQPSNSLSVRGPPYAADVPDDPAALLAVALRTVPAAPLITFYDDATGERTELSTTTVANWVAKSANLLRDELGLAERAAVTVALPLHWQTAVLLLACWAIGAEVTLLRPDSDVEATELLVAAEDDLDRLAGVDAQAVLALSLLPMNRPLTAPRPGVLDYAADVLALGDRFTPYAPVDADVAALRAAPRSCTARELVDSASSLAAGLSGADRLLSVLPMDGVDGVLAGLLAPLAAGCGVVLCANSDPAELPHRAETENVTRTAGVHIGGIPALPLSG